LKDKKPKREKHIQYIEELGYLLLSVYCQPAIERI